MWGQRGTLDRNVDDGEESAETESDGALYILSGIVRLRNRCAIVSQDLFHPLTRHVKER